MSAAQQSDAIRRFDATDRYLRNCEAAQARYAVPPVDFAQWSLDTVAWQGDEAILDIGAGGAGQAIRLAKARPGFSFYAVSLSPGVLRRYPGGDRLAQGNPLRLPYADNSFDLVLANHILYHLPQIDGCLREIKRVLKPAGRLLATTDSLHSLPELQVLLRRAIVLLSDNGARIAPPSLPCDSFALENGTRILSHHFYAVVRHDLPCNLVFEDVDAAIDYLDGMRDLRQQDLPQDVSWDDILLIMRQQLTQLLHLLGKLEIHTTCGVLLASDCGDFIHEFVSREQEDSAS